MLTDSVLEFLGRLDEASAAYAAFLSADPQDPENVDRVYSMDTWMQVTTDGGATFRYVAPVTPALKEPGFAIMPSSVRLSPSHIVTAVRCRGERRCGEQRDKFETARCWIDVYCSEDDGQTWRHLSRPVPDTGTGGKSKKK